MKDRVRALFDRKISSVTKEYELMVFRKKRNGLLDFVHDIEGLTMKEADGYLDSFKTLGIRDFMSHQLPEYTHEEIAEEYPGRETDYYGEVGAAYTIRFTDAPNEKLVAAMHDVWYHQMNALVDGSKTSGTTKALMKVMYSHPLKEVEAYLESRVQ